MESQDAKNQLPKFVHLKGYFSKQYNSCIKDVLISSQEPTLAQQHFEQYKKGLGWPKIPSDDGQYTIVAVLDDDKLVPIKSIIANADDLQYLTRDAEILDDMH
jgi:hypothetical protein